VKQSEAMHKDASASLFAPISPAYTLTEAYAYCRHITRRSASNFYYAFRLLPAEQHNALCAFYAFCRFLDDVTDQPARSAQLGQEHRPAERSACLLDTWREELHCCFAGTPRHPISQALADSVQRFPIRQEHLAGIIDGVAMDLYRSRYYAFPELYDYCYHVAALVGLVCIEILGYRNPSAREYAVHLGVAFQLTNILRDVGEDARRGRIYLPMEDLTRFGYSEHDLLAETHNCAFVRLMTFQEQRATEYYEKAVSSLAPEDRRSLAAAEAMRFIYYRLLRKLAAQDFNTLKTRVTLATPYKLTLVLIAWVRGRLPM
jgi:15-cis-phytoene synthase